MLIWNMYSLIPKVSILPWKMPILAWKVSNTDAMEYAGARDSSFGGDAGCLVHPKRRSEVRISLFPTAYSAPPGWYIGSKLVREW